MGRRRTLKAIDLFAGAGGMSSGLVAAGLRVVAAVERDEDAAETYRANHDGTKVYQEDISTLSPLQVLKDVGLKPGELDVLAGCPPCQGFTRLTEKNGKRDPRNSLVRDYVRFVEVMKPRACMFENVPGLETRGKKLFAELKAALRRLDYKVTYQVLQLADYGVPQFRRRLVLLAGRDTTIQIPKATHGSPGSAKEENLRPWRTVAEAIGDLPSPPKRSDVKTKRVKAPYAWHFSRDSAKLVERRLKYAVEKGGRAALPPSLRLACHQKSCDGYNDVYGAMAWDEPSPTITGGATNASKGRFGHPAEPRAITATEAALLQTFPLGYRFKGTGVESVAAQIGNALPRRFAKVLGKTVADALRAESDR